MLWVEVCQTILERFKRFPKVGHEMSKKSPVFIGITGTHCVGKTTLAEKLTALSISRGLKAVTLEEVVRKVAELNDPKFKIHGEQTIYSTNLIIQKQMEFENSLLTSDYDIVFCDRTVIDPLYYFFSIPKNEKKLEDFLKSKTVNGLEICNVFDANREMFMRYQDIIYVKLGMDEAFDEQMTEDGFRDTDTTFRFKVQDTAKKILSTLTVRHPITHYALTIPLDNDRYYNNLLNDIIYIY